MNKTWRSALSMLLAFCLILGVCANGLAIMAVPADGEQINYVSLGDSMTNGYGLDGYEFEYHCTNNNPDVPGCWYPDYGFCGTGAVHEECTDPNCTKEHYIWGDANGFRQLAWDAYPHLFAEELRKAGNTVKHSQMAMAGMTSDMMRWILEFPINNPDHPKYDLAMEILTMEEWSFVECGGKDHTGCYKCKLSNGMSVEQAWHTIWNYGDYHTYDQGPDSARMEKFCPQYIYANMYDTLGSSGDTVAEYLKLYQDAVSNADIISLCIGNGDFGNHMLNRIMWLIVGHIDHELRYDMDYAIGSLTEEQQKFILELEQKLQELVILPDVPKENSDRVIECMVYTTMAYIVNFEGILKQISVLNPNAEIVLLGMVESMKGMTIQLEDGSFFPLGEIMDLCVEFGNIYAASYVAGLRETNEITNTVYYAEATEEVGLIYESYSTSVYDPANYTVRNRFFKSIDDQHERILDYLGQDVLGDANANFCDNKFNLDDIKAYEDAGYVTDSVYKNAFEIYLGFEKAIVEAVKEGGLTIKGLTLMYGDTDEVRKPGYAHVKDAMLKWQAREIDKPLREVIAEALLNNIHTKSVMYQYGRANVGNFLGNHPTEEGHAVLFNAVVSAYTGEHSVENESANAKSRILGMVKDLLEKNNYFSASEKLGLIEQAIGLTSDIESLQNNSDIQLVLDLYEYLGDYLTDEEMVQVLVYCCDTLQHNDNLTNEVKIDIVKFIFEIAAADMTNSEKADFVFGMKAILDKYGLIDNMSGDDKTAMLEGIVDYLKDAGYVEAIKNGAIEYAQEITDEVKDILVENLQPTVEKLEGELQVMNGQYEDLASKLESKLADLAAKQEILVNKLLAERDALVAELEALNAKLVAIKNGTFTRTVPTTDALDALIADTEAAIAETEAEIAELDAAIAWAYEQITSDLSGIEAIKAALAVIKNDIIATEAALAEVNAAIDQLIADLAILDEALLVLADAAQHLADKTGVEIDVKEVLAAAITVVKNLPALIEHLEEAYNATVETIEMVKTAVAEIKASAAEIKAVIENIVDAAEEFVDIAGEQAEELFAIAVEMHDLAVELVEKNMPEIEAALKKVHEELKAVALRELAEAEKMYEENEELLMAALALGYVYAEEKGYIQDAKDLIFEYTDLTQDDLDALKEDLTYAETILEKLLKQAERHYEEKLLPVVDAELDRLYEELKAYGESIDPEIKAEYEHAIETLKAQKAELQKKLDEIKSVIVAVRDYIDGVKAAIDNVSLALNDFEAALLLVNGDLKALVSTLENLKNTMCKLSASIADLHTAVVGEVNRVLGYADIVADEAIDVVASLQNFVELINHVPAILKEAVIHATNDHYLVSQDSHFVALGDANAYGAAADLLAAHLSNFLGAQIGYENATVSGLTAADLLAMLPELKETLAKADLVTIGFSANTFTQFVVDQVTGMLMGTEVVELDWEALLGADGAAYVAEAMEELKAELVANGAGEMMGMDLSDLVTIAIESYAYAYAEFVINYVQVVNGVHAINPEAQVVLVGMHNPLAGVILDMNGTEIALGDYLQYIVEVSNAYAFGYAFIVPETIYVDAPAVETATEAGTQNAITFLMSLVMTGTEDFAATDAGYAYIEEQIWNALNAYKKGLLGDVDSNGVVNHIDAMLVLQYYTEVVGADDLDLGVADVDGNGVINHVDSMLILQYYTEVIEVFPAA